MITIDEKGVVMRRDQDEVEFFITGLRQKTTRKQPQTQLWQKLYAKRLKIAETQVYPATCLIEVKQLLCIGLRLFLPHDCLSPDKRVGQWSYLRNGKD
ncbi:MAG: hypothetical protein GVY17_14975 [Cyanobacteria bacterium]|nr:hypothetical protein [Cyanobacteria bacterium GSL.Bin21]